MLLPGEGGGSVPGGGKGTGCVLCSDVRTVLSHEESPELEGKALHLPVGLHT